MEYIMTKTPSMLRSDGDNLFLALNGLGAYSNDPKMAHKFVYLYSKCV